MDIYIFACFGLRIGKANISSTSPSCLTRITESTTAKVVDWCALYFSYLFPIFFFSRKFPFVNSLFIIIITKIRWFFSIPPHQSLLFILLFTYNFPYFDIMNDVPISFPFSFNFSISKSIHFVLGTRVPCATIDERKYHHC